MDTTNVRPLSASTLTGDDVKNPQGESLGDLKDIMLDVGSGKIAYGVVSFGGVLGMGNKLFAVPWDSFTVDEENQQLLLNASTERLKNAPGFDKDHWPKLGDPTYANQVRDYYRVEDRADRSDARPPVNRTSAPPPAPPAQPSSTPHNR